MTTETEPQPVIAPETATERFRQLHEGGTSERESFTTVLSEEQWWDTTRQREAATLAHNAGIACHTSLLVGLSTAETEYVRFTHDDNRRVLFNPYSKIRSVPRFTIDHADTLAKALKIPLTSPDRHAAIYLKALSVTLGSFGTEGDTHVKYDDVALQARKLIPREALDIEEITAELNGTDIELFEVEVPPPPGITNRSGATRMQRRVTTRALYQAERRIAERAASPGRYGTEFPLPGIPGDLDAAQREAFARAFTEPLSVITARPGHGKTHTVAAIARAAVQTGVTVAAGAFMGRAANRIRQELIKADFDPDKLNHGPGTLHSILQLSPGTKGNNNGAIGEQEGIFLIDEASMLSVSLLGAVVNALPPGWNVVLVGDSDQLPAIDPGNTLADLIDSGTVPVTTLGTNYRTDIPELTEAISTIQARKVPATGDESFRVIPMTREAANEGIARIARDAAQEAGCTPEQVFIVTAQKGGKAQTNTNTLNRALKAGLNPREFRRAGWWEVSPGDRVYATGGNAAHRLYSDKKHFIQRAFTGDLGTVTSIGQDGQALVNWDDHPGIATYERGETRGPDRILDLAWAVTVHKVQGAETPAVIFVADSTAWSGLLNRQLAYTACSRARKLAIVVDIAGGFGKAVRKDPRQRLTMLPMFLDEFNGD